jgi:hypothetical protein
MVRHQKGTREMRTEDELWWLDIELIGFEDGDDDDDEDTEDSDDEDENSEDEEDDSSDDDDSDDDDEDDDEKPDVKGLKSALTKERAERRRLAKENKALKKAQASKPPAKKAAAKKGESEDEEDESSKPDEEAQRRNERLAGKLLNNAVDTAIIKYAGTRFTDIDDVLALINRDEIDAEQDDDDPSEVTVDRESVKEAIKQLAKKKPHLVAKEKSNGSQTGSKFGGRKKSGSTMTEEQLKDKYPALRDR